MADFNKFGRALADQAQSVSQRAASTIADATGNEPTVDVAGEVGRLRALVDQKRPAPGPVTGRWSLGFGDVLANHPATPTALRGILGKLDRYGGLGIGEQAVSVDGNEVPWSAVTEVRTQSFVEYLLSGALQEQVRTIPVPWFPGRKKVLEAVSKALLTVLFAAAHEQLNRREGIRVPAEIRYRAATRARSVSPGVMATLLLADPAVSQCLFATAARQGVTVVDDSPPWAGSVEQRAGQLRGRLAGLESKLGQWRLDSDSPEPSSGESPPSYDEPPPPSQRPDTPDFAALPADFEGASSVTDPHQPLFPSSNNAPNADPGPVGYPQIGAVGAGPPAAGGGGRPPTARQIPQSWIIVGAVVAVAAVIVGVIAFVGSSDSKEASGTRQVDSTGAGPSDVFDSSGTSDPSESGSTRPDTRTETVPPPLVQAPDTYGDACGNGFHVTGRSGWATNGGRGSAETSCSFARSVLLAYWDQYGSPSTERRTVTAAGRVPCPTTGGAVCRR